MSVDIEYPVGVPTHATPAFQPYAYIDFHGLELTLQFAIQEGNFWRRMHRAEKTMNGKFAHIQGQFIELAKQSRMEGQWAAAETADLAAEAIGKARMCFPKENGPVLSHVKTVAQVVLHRAASRWINPGIVIAEGEAYLSPDDVRDDEEGRQVALGRALAQLFPHVQNEVFTSYVLRPNKAAGRQQSDQERQAA